MSLISNNICGLLLFCFLIQIDACARTRPPNRTTVAPTTAGTTTAAETTTTAATTTTEPLVPCDPPDDMSAGLTVDDGTITRDNGLNHDPNAHCTTCEAGERSFWPTATGPDPTDAQGNTEVAITVACTDVNLCLCNTAGVCCQPTDATTVPDNVQLIPFCSGGVCQMNTFIGGDPTAELTCDNGDVFALTDQYDAGGNFAQLNSGTYFIADSVSCNGCAAIEDDVCEGPTIPDP